ncbi:MAG: IclR family transcriptional regulator [Longimicrobiales bacterium]
MNQSSPVTMTLERGLQVLRAFRAERVPLTNGELVRRTGLPKSTVSRLTMTLVSMGFLRRVADGPQFELASGPLGIGHAYLETSEVTRLAHPFMQQLADRLDVSVALAVPDHLDMLYVAYRTSTRIATLRLGIGSLLPMGLTAIGRAWLWGLPEDARGDYIASVIAAAGPQAEQVRKNVDTAFDDLRTTGVCMSVGEYQRNAYGIALPLRVGSAGTLMSLNCGAVELRPDMDAIRARIVPELKAAAVELMVLLRNAGTEA